MPRAIYTNKPICFLPHKCINWLHFLWRLQGIIFDMQKTPKLAYNVRDRLYDDVHCVTSMSHGTEYNLKHHCIWHTIIGKSILCRNIIFCLVGKNFTTDIYTIVYFRLIYTVSWDTFFSTRFSDLPIANMANRTPIIVEVRVIKAGMIWNASVIGDICSFIPYFLYSSFVNTKMYAW